MICYILAYLLRYWAGLIKNYLYNLVQKKSYLFSGWFDGVELDSMVVSLISELAGEFDKSGNSASSLGSKGSTVEKNSKSGLVENKKTVKSRLMSRNFLEM